MLEIVYHQDFGHGWVEVTRAKLVELGVKLGEITRYSYQSSDGATVYLEEDCDAARLLRELKGKAVPFDVTEKHLDVEHHWIRNLPRFAA